MDFYGIMLAKKLGGGGGGVTPTGTLDISANGNYDVTEYAEADVNVPNTYTASDEGKVVSNGALVGQTSATKTENGTYDTTLNNEIVVNVPQPSGTVNITQNGTVDVAQYASASVNVPSGVSNVFVGDFTASNSSGTQTITFDYGGTGFPVAVFIYPYGGVKAQDNGIADAIKQYGFIEYTMMKNDMGTSEYGSSSTDSEKGTAVASYKSSSSSATSTSYNGNNVVNMFSTSTGGTIEGAVKMTGRTEMKIYVAKNSYGFIPNGHYSYVIVYSAS